MKKQKVYELLCSQTVMDSVFIEATDLEEAKKIANEGYWDGDLGFNTCSSDWIVNDVQEVEYE